MKNNLLGLKNVSLSFGENEVFTDLDFTVEKGEFVAIIGPSGCGKTTLLNLFAGALKPSRGEVFCNGSLRTVYQQSSLFPWLTVEENIALGLGAEASEKTSEMLKIIHLTNFAKHYPHQLSGGMKQRVELGRALLGETEILLLDEPFSALDYLTRLKMRAELVRMLEEFPRTAVLVTHDIEEAVQLADRVVILSGNPASIRKEFRLQTKTPRKLTDAEFVSTVGDIFAEMGLYKDEGKKDFLSVEETAITL
ncbi:MAG TPA: ABC transporter ATP-binding protein [Pyrinomonadaceae bacterium]|nr:ABC transporter ATP-binding protein [Pyrinomonadaceae bacterium]